MKRADKFLLFLISLICLVFAAGLLSVFYYIPYVSETMDYFRKSFYWFDGVLVGFFLFLGAVSLFFMFFAVFAPARHANLILKKDRGTLKFSKKSIESTAKLSFADISGIHFSQVNAKIYKKPEKLKIFVKLSIYDLNCLVEMTETVQKRIEAVLRTSLGLSARTINIKVIKYRPNDKFGGISIDKLEETPAKTAAEPKSKSKAKTAEESLAKALEKSAEKVPAEAPAKSGEKTPVETPAKSEEKILAEAQAETAAKATVKTTAAPPVKAPAKTPDKASKKSRVI